MTSTSFAHDTPTPECRPAELFAFRVKGQSVFGCSGWAVHGASRFLNYGLVQSK
ncbi:predicted protein [Streptomyces viridosporus ATCC 14672]|uniref:Predicted protein n=1 Tax=Streptomyces viridosporus (strain ATCC 14672 / DSM 40746 / JCM 4963 / KCTC 9882 / NRRL B-12104 / FH 1290) TaxID=566461 RepID=D5ZWX2_STRV1|nr:predicted protein [Streptomyces viridosporus ATCC 14672]